MKKLTFIALSLAAFAAPAQTLNLYSARHYQTDEQLYTNFTQATGIKINRLELGDEPLLERLKAEGASSPADVILLVDAARLWKAQIDGLFAPIQSKTLETKIPAQYRAKDGSWFGFSTHGRVIVYNKSQLNASQVDTYEKLAEPALKGKLCTRSGSHPYNLSLFGSFVERNGVEKAEKQLAGMVANLARTPKGGDTDQIRAVASGECGVAITNTYYWARLLRSTAAADKDIVAKVGMIFPNQATSGAHLNIAGGAVAKHSKNKAAAQQFLEYLASDAAQGYFADGNNEWPVVTTVKIDNPALKAMGSFKAEAVNTESMGMRQVTAQRLLDKVGYK